PHRLDTTAQTSNGVDLTEHTQPDQTRRTTITFTTPADMVQTFGPQDMLLRVLDGVYPDLKLLVRDQQLDITGPAEDVAQAIKIVHDLHSAAGAGTTVDPEIIETTIAGIRAYPDNTAMNMPAELIVSAQGKKIRPQTENPNEY